MIPKPRRPIRAAPAHAQTFLSIGVTLRVSPDHGWRAEPAPFMPSTQVADLWPGRARFPLVKGLLVSNIPLGVRQPLFLRQHRKPLHLRLVLVMQLPIKPVCILVYRFARLGLERRQHIPTENQIDTRSYYDQQHQYNDK